MKEKKDLEDLNKSEGINSYFQLGEVLSYFKRLFGKKDPSKPSNVNLRMMHGVNRISILMFVIAVIVMIVRAFMRS